MGGRGPHSLGDRLFLGRRDAATENSENLHPDGFDHRRCIIALSHDPKKSPGRSPGLDSRYENRLLHEHEADATILGAAFAGAVVGDGLVLTVRRHVHAVQGETLLAGEILHDLLGALVAEAQVVALAADVVGVALDLEIGADVLRDDLRGEGVEGGLGLIRQVRSCRNRSERPDRSG